MNACGHSAAHRAPARRGIALAGLVLVLLSGPAAAQRWVDLGGRRGLGDRVRASGITVTGLVLSADLPGFVQADAVLPDGNRYDLVRDAAGSPQLPGQPDVPSYPRWILVPNGCTVRLDIRPGQPRIFPGLDLAPVQPAPADSGNAPPVFTRDAAVYGRDGFFPGDLATFDGIDAIRGQAVRLLRLHPFQYNPVTRELRVYPDLDVRVIFEGTRTRRDPRLAHPHFDRLFAAAPNAAAVLGGKTAPRAAPAGAARDGTSGAEFLIICADPFTNAAADLAAWKRRRGISTAVATTNETGGTTNSIHAYITNACAAWDPAPAYVLLLGDSDFIPPWYVTDHPAGLRKNATDLFYADLSDPPDRVADLAIGRWPVETETQASAFAQRVIEYESAPPDPSACAAFYTTATLCASFQGYTNSSTYEGYSERRFTKTTEDLRDVLVDAGVAAVRIYAEYQGTNPTHWANWVTGYSALFENDNWPVGGNALPADLLKPGFAWDGGRTDIRAAVNAGTFLLTHRDHGYKGGWSKPAFNRTTDVDILTNGSLRPVVFSINCQTGWFDNETDDAAAGTADDSECFAEHWIRHATGGAIGLVAPTRTSYSYHNDRFTWGLADSLWTNFLSFHGAAWSGGEASPRMGDVLNRAKLYYATEYALSGNTAQCTVEIFHWLGDPTLEMWTAVPQALDVVHTNALGEGAAALTVEVAQAGAFVCCTRSNEILGTAVAAGGSAVVSLDPPPAGGGDLLVTTTLRNYLPALGTVTVVRADADDDGLPDAWEAEHFESTDPEPDGDEDEDGFSNFAEWVGGTDPMDPGSRLATAEPVPDPGGGCVLQWPSVEGRIYAVARTTNLLDPFAPLVSNLAATAPLNTYTDTLATNAGFWFYQLRVATNAP